MKCNEVQELISSAVDNQLDPDQKEILKKHLEICPKCKNDYNTELLTKKIVSLKCCISTVPDSVRDKIVKQISYSSGEKNLLNSVINPLKKYWYVPIPAILIILFLIISPKSNHKHPVNLAENNLIKIVYTHFEELINGEVKQFIRNSDPSELKTVLTMEAGYNIEIPEIKNCQILGGWVTNEFGKKVVHTAYQEGENMIYCSQMNFNDLIKDSMICIHSEIIEKLKSEGRYISKDFDCCSVILWLNGNQLHTAAAEMDAHTLLTHLIKKEE